LADSPVEYEEFAMLGENAAEYGLPFPGSPRVERVAVPLGDGRDLSAIAWGEGAPELVLLHGGGQNAHTWDTVALALDRPLVAIDLPGHGHSDGSRTGSMDVATNAQDIASAVEDLDPRRRRWWGCPSAA